MYSVAAWVLAAKSKQLQANKQTKKKPLHCSLVIIDHPPTHPQKNTILKRNIITELRTLQFLHISGGLNGRQQRDLPVPLMTSRTMLQE